MTSPGKKKKEEEGRGRGRKIVFLSRVPRRDRERGRRLEVTEKERGEKKKGGGGEKKKNGGQMAEGISLCLKREPCRNPSLPSLSLCRLCQD